jgi:cytoskeletal protein RodZ
MTMMREKAPDYSGLGVIADELTAARNRTGRTLDDLSEKLMIRKKFLMKIEKGDLLFLPKAYVYNFVRKYASEMGLVDEFRLARCRRELLIETTPEKKIPVHHAEAGSKNGRERPTSNNTMKRPELSVNP